MKSLRWALSIALGVLLFYGITVLFNWQFNPTGWSREIKVFTFILGLASGISFISYDEWRRNNK